MKGTNFLESTLDGIEFLLKWLVIWFFVSMIAGVFLVLIVTGLTAAGLKSVALPVSLLFCAVVALAALIDLSFRIRGLPSLLSLLHQSRAAKVLSLAVDAGEKVVVSTATRIARLVGWLLLAALFALAAYCLYRGVAALPVSVAVIIGAIIIASALRSK